ncbi:MAG: serine/threonine-protein kinase [Elusimicrobiaceae bacterium]|nr:serine/threonine-protein kinase [Elusimicrobiaceae bacterium]
MLELKFDLLMHRLILAAALCACASVCVHAQTEGLPGASEQECMLKISVEEGKCANSENSQLAYRNFLLKLRQENPAVFKPSGRAELEKLKHKFWYDTLVECGSASVPRNCAVYAQDATGRNLVKEVAEMSASVIEFRETGKPVNLQEFPPEVLFPQNDNWQRGWNSIVQIVNDSASGGASGNTIALTVPRLCRKAQIPNDKCWEYLPALSQKLAEENREMASIRQRRPGQHNSGSNHHGGQTDDSGSDETSTGTDSSASPSSSSSSQPGANSSGSVPVNSQSGLARLASGVAGQTLLAGGFESMRDDGSPIMVEGAYAKGKRRPLNAGRQAFENGERNGRGSDSGSAARSNGGSARNAAGAVNVTPQAQLAEQYLRNAKEKESYDPARAALEASRAIAANPSDPSGYAARAVYMYKASSDKNADAIMLDTEKALSLAGTDPNLAGVRFQMHNIRRLLYKSSGDTAGEMREARLMLDELQTAALHAKTPRDRDKYKELLVRGYQEYRDRLADYSLLPELGLDSIALAAVAEQPGAVKPAPAAEVSLPLQWRLYAIGVGLLTTVGFLIWLVQFFRRNSGKEFDAALPSEMQNYEVIRKLGEGGMGQVFLAEDKVLGRKVAIKQLHTELGMSDDAREQLLNEARTVASLRHPNIVDIYTVFREKGDLYLVFEYVDGETLEHKLDADGKMPLAEAKPIFEAICKALTYAHKNGIIHRDLKLSNIMLASTGIVKVMDFGVARKMDAKPAATVSGTPAYMAPEQRRGLVRPESDIYSLGICFYEAITGHIPWELEGVHPDSEYIIAPTQIDSTLPKAVDQLLEMALCEDYNERIATASEFWEILKTI